MVAMTMILLQTSGDAAAQALEMLLKLTGLSLAQHTVAAFAIVFLVQFLQDQLLRTEALKRLTPALPVLLGVVYFVSPLAGMAESPMTTRLVFGCVFGFALIGGRDALKNFKGDYTKKEAA